MLLYGLKDLVISCVTIWLKFKSLQHITISADHKNESDSNNVFRPQPEEDPVVSKHVTWLLYTYRPHADMKRLKDSGSCLLLIAVLSQLMHIYTL